MIQLHNSSVTVMCHCRGQYNLYGRPAPRRQRWCSEIRRSFADDSKGQDGTRNLSPALGANKQVRNTGAKAKPF